MKSLFLQLKTQIRVPKGLEKCKKKELSLDWWILKWKKFSTEKSTLMCNMNLKPREEDNILFVLL
jgi:hypothetical protein